MRFNETGSASTPVESEGAIPFAVGRQSIGGAYDDFPDPRPRPAILRPSRDDPRQKRQHPNQGIPPHWNNAALGGAESRRERHYSNGRESHDSDVSEIGRAHV